MVIQQWWPFPETYPSNRRWNMGEMMNDANKGGGFKQTQISYWWPPFLMTIFFLDSQTDPHIIWVVMYPAIFLWMVGFSMISPLFWPYFSLWSSPKSIEDHLLRLCRDRLQGVTTRATKYHHVHKNGTWWHTKQRLDNIPNFAMPPLK
jgi:hypothetical protein